MRHLRLVRLSVDLRRLSNLLEGYFRERNPKLSLASFLASLAIVECYAQPAMSIKSYAYPVPVPA